jgi:phospholipid/cholesterol/gamma-HCH transport system permease protein
VRELLRPALVFVEELGNIVLMFVQVLYWTVRPPYRFRLLLQMMEFVGVGSLFIIVLTGSFSGAVMGLQGIYAFKIIEGESMVGGSVFLVLSRELSPVLAALMVTGRVGSAMATELGTMRVTEQLDAMETMAVNPIQYLMVPRVWATVTMMPVLCVLFTLVGMAGCYLVAVAWMQVDEGQFMARIASFGRVGDLFDGMLKAAIFGAALSVIACYKGYAAAGGARGVGVATTQAVVLASVGIFVLDYLLTAIMF